MFLSRITGRGWRHALLGTLAVAALAACGGGTSQYEPFVPQRLFSFGDESSALIASPSGGGTRKYAVNFIATTNAVDTIDCFQQPIWIQAVANLYTFVYKECNPSAVAVPQAATFASPGAKVADLAAQVVQAGTFREDDLITMLMGANDILEYYRDNLGTVPEDAMLAEMRLRGEQMANVVNDLVKRGPRVILSTVPDLGLTPYARKQELLGAGRAALLSRMTQAFNEQLGVKIVLDGSLVGLVQGDQMVQSMVRSPASFALNNATDAVCLETVELPDCSTKTLITGGDASLYLWADDTRMSYGGHAYLGQLAQARAQQNPF